MALLHLQDLHVYYGSIHALRGLSIDEVRWAFRQDDG